MLRFEGDRDFRQTPSEVWARLGDARFLASCVPDAESVSRADADEAALVVRPGLAFVRGTLEVTLRLADRQPPTAARIDLLSKGIGSSSRVEVALTLTPLETGTRVHWVAELKELGGLLKMVPSGLIRGAAEKVINDAWSRVAAALKQVSRAAVTWMREPDRYRSSPIAQRGHCRDCGTPLTYEGDGSDGLDLTVGSFDAPELLTPVSHSGVESMHEAWLDTRDLPRERTQDNRRIVQKWMDARGQLPD